MSESRLQKIDLDDFNGGVNLRASQFTLGDDESPEMLNIEIDIRGGIKTRKGWERWNDDDIVATPTAVNWLPRQAWVHPLEDGSYLVYTANDGDIYVAPSSGVFAQLEAGASDPIVCTASPHLADGASWGNTAYIACGNGSPSVSRNGVATYATRLADAYGAYNDDYTAPASGTMPRCEHIEPHAGYLFAAYTNEGGAEPNRLRWSHPAGFVEDWATDDYIDIDATGGHITGLLSFRDHLLIFKTDAIFALYGYSTESFQLVRVPGNYGAPHPQAITRSETAVYFYSASGINGIYAYIGGEPIYISDKVAEATTDISDIDEVWVRWIGRRLWCSIPWKFNADDDGTQSSLIFDPSIGEQGSWVIHRSALGDLTCIVEGSDRTGLLPLAAIEGSSGAACFVRLEARDDANDQILEGGDTTPFQVAYRTRWLNAGWPERRKSWRRPRFVFQIPDAAVSVDIDLFADYNDNNETRTGSVELEAGNIAYWRATGALETNGFDWGDGSLWSGGARGATIERMTTQSQGWGLGVNRATQLRFSTNEAFQGVAWGLDLITVKYILRRFTT